MIDTLKVKNLRNDHEFANLKIEISKRSKKNKIYFIPAAGNWGDGLINYGSRQFFEVNGFDYEEIDRPKAIQTIKLDSSFKERVVVVGGGGAWSRNFSSTYNLVKQIAPLVEHILILPTTFELPRVENDNITYFSRDQHLSKNTVPESFFCHDMAFYIDLEIPVVENRIWRLFAMRNDREGLGYAGHFSNNIDISKLGDATYKFIAPFYQMISLFNVITTDRMHIAIAASMIGRKVNLIGGNYPKSYDVYRSSIEKNYKSTEFRDFEDIKKWAGISN